jgi:hypothetical protein
MARIVRLMVLFALLGLVAVPALSAPEQPTRPGNLLSGPSALAGFRYYLAHPDQAPDGLQGRFQAAHAVAERAQGARRHGNNPRAPFGDLFNRDTVGLPQNETSISDCTSNPKVLLGGTNDYRGIIDPQGNFTGWHLSVDGGRSVANEGLLPPVQVAGQAIPSGGDPVFVTGKGCSLYGASLNYGSGPLGETPSAVGSTARTSRRRPAAPRATPTAASPIRSAGRPAGWSTWPAQAGSWTRNGWTSAAAAPPVRSSGSPTVTWATSTPTATRNRASSRRSAAGPT